MGVPQITVVTPSYNHAAFLRRCIDSVLEQAYPNLQYFVHDGGSTDGTVEILKGYGDAICWRSERDRGQAAAVNEGFRKSDGDLVAWLNSDDYYLPGAFDHAVNAFEEHPGAAMIYGRARLVDEAGHTIRPYPTFAFHRRDLARKCYVCQPTVFVRRSVLDEVGLLNEDFDICIDYEWWLRIGRDHTLAFCDHELAASRLYPATKTKGPAGTETSRFWSKGSAVTETGRFWSSRRLSGDSGLRFASIPPNHRSKRSKGQAHVSADAHPRNRGRVPDHRPRIG